MNHIRPDSRLAQAIIENPSLIPVINRLGLDLGVGDSTVDATCAAHGIDPDLFIAVVNTYLSDSFDPAPLLANVKPSVFDSYAKATDSYYYHRCLPNIERHLHALLGASDPGSSLEMMSRLFSELKKLLSARVEEGSARCPDTAVIDMLSDLRNLMIVHLRGRFDRNLIYAVVVAIVSLENDMRRNLRIMRARQ